MTHDPRLAPDEVWCARCDGDGRILPEDDPTDPWRVCPECAGDGRLIIEVETTEYRVRRQIWRGTKAIGFVATFYEGDKWAAHLTGDDLIDNYDTEAEAIAAVVRESETKR